MTKDGSPWVATIATDPANVGRVAVRAAALKVNGDPIDRDVLIKPSVITQEFLKSTTTSRRSRTCAAKLPELDTKDTATADWIPKALVSVALQDVAKAFGSTQALRGVSLDSAAARSSPSSGPTVPASRR